MSMGPPALGPYVEVEDPNGNQFFPEVRDITGQPVVNGRPRIRITVPRDDRWRTLVDNNPDSQIKLRVWEDGQRRPIDTLENTEDAPDGTVLIGSGGRELGQRVQKSVDQQETHLVAKDLVENNTTLTANVDTPSTTTTTNETLKTISSTADWISAVSITNTDPFAVNSGTLEVLDTNESDQAANDVRNDGWGVDSSYSGSDSGEALISGDVGEVVAYELSTDYDFPATDGNSNNIQIRWRSEVYDPTGDGDNGDADKIEVRLDGESIATEELGAGTDFAVRGVDLDLGGNPLNAGTHRLAFEVKTENTEDWALDWVAISDGRFSVADRFNNTKPTEAKIVVDEVPAAQAVTGGRAETNITVQQIELSNDQGDSFGVSGTSTSSVEGDFSSPSRGPSLTARLELGDDQSSVSSLTLKADLEDMPMTVNKDLSGTIANILSNDLADPTEQLWEYRRSGGTETVEWTQPGARTTDDDPALSNFSITTSAENIVNKAIVFGRSQDRRGERFVASHGTAVDLAFGEIHERSQIVRDPTTGETYRRGPDYSINWADGQITTKTGGAMTDGDVYEIDYRYQVKGEFDNGSADDQTTSEFELPGLTTEMTCQQAARIIVDELEAPLVEATATAVPDELGWTVIEEIDISDLPGESLRFKNIEPTPEQIVFQLGNRRSRQELLSDLRTQLSTVSRRF